MLSRSEIQDIDLSRTYCDCGCPDPLNEDHTENCTMQLPTEVLLEVEAICDDGPFVWNRIQVRYV